jgi:replicative DNA helicase
MSGVATGFSKLDQLTSGWQPSDLVIIAARPGMGKTAFVMSMAKNMAIDFDIPVAIFSLEMSSVQLITRMISSETGISSEKLRKGNLETYEWEALNVKVKKLSDAPIFIDDTPSLSVFDLRAKARRLVSQHNVRCVIIDYLQLMTAGSSTKSSGNREQEISTISRNLKALAKELSVPVIALSQLSRAVETRGGSKRPLLSDPRESGAIEQDADIVSFIYRPEYYGLTEWDDDERTPCDGQAEFIIAKHRNGGLENIRMKFIGRLAKFANLDEGFETEFQSSMNEGQISPSNFTSANDAFGKVDNDDDVPF